MDAIRMVITIILMIVSVLLVIVVMMQQSKESGLGAAFGGETSTLSAKGRSASREAKLRRLTVIFASIIGLLAIVMTALPNVTII